MKQLDLKELEEPVIQRACARERQGDKDGAIALLNKALKQKPDIAQAYLKLAVLYDDYKKDYIRAIYHYERYLELRPKTEKGDMIRGRILEAEMSFVEAFSDKLSGINTRYLKLQKENAQLKEDLQKVRENRASLIKGSSPPPSGAKSDIALVKSHIDTAKGESQSKPLDSGARIYQVQPKDSLSKISAEIYNDSGQWKKIYNANRDILPNPDHLRVGQVLIIPE